MASRGHFDARDSQAEAAAERLRGESIDGSKNWEIDLLQQRPAREQQVARRPAHVEHGSIRS